MTHRVVIWSTDQITKLGIVYMILQPENTTSLNDCLHADPVLQSPFIRYTYLESSEICCITWWY